MQLDTERKALVSAECSINLTRREYHIVELLIRRPGVVRSRDELMDHAWGINDAVYERTVDSQIKRLRRKLEKTFGIDPIATRYGFGYTWELSA